MNRQQLFTIVTEQLREGVNAGLTTGLESRHMNNIHTYQLS